MRTLQLTASVSREGGTFVAQCLDVDVVSQGDSVEEALSYLKEALELYFEDQPIPDVVAAITAQVVVNVA